MKQILILILITGFGVPVLAQKKQPSKPTPPAPMKVVNNPETQYLSGEVRVNVHGNDEVTIIRLGLAQNGSTFIEFPKDDFFYTIHPPENADILKLEDSPTRIKDHYLLVRPGSSFLPSAGKAPSAAGTITVQMTSGKVIVFMIYPVGDISQQAHRCAVLYDRKTVVSQRKAIGLAVNLDGKEDPEPVVQPKQTSEIVVPSPSPANRPSSAPQLSAAVAEAGNKQVVTSKEAPKVEEKIVPVQSITPVKDLKKGKPPKRDPKAEPIVVNVPVAVEPKKTEAKPVEPVRQIAPNNPPVQSSPKPPEPRIKPTDDGKRLLGIFPKDDPVSPATTWVKSSFGLSAMGELAYIGSDARIVKLWVRNVTGVPMKIVPGQPELWIYTRDAKGKVLQIEPVRILKTETTAQNGVIRGNGQEVFQLSFNAPILGVQQKLCVSIAQANAADQPLLVEITVPGVR